MENLWKAHQLKYEEYKFQLNSTLSDGTSLHKKIIQEHGFLLSKARDMMKEIDAQRETEVCQIHEEADAAVSCFYIITGSLSWSEIIKLNDLPHLHVLVPGTESANRRRYFCE